MTLAIRVITALPFSKPYARIRYIQIGHIRYGLYPTDVSSASGVPALTTAGFQVLLALASGHSHGYAVMGFVDQLTDGQVRLGPGTLYRTLARLVADELVSESEVSDPSAPHDARRRYYQLTPLGAEAVREEAELLARLVDAARTAGLLDRERRTT
jgi:DNA-binding PadR family transcriptional regulator